MTDYNRVFIENKIAQTYAPQDTMSVRQALLSVPYRTPAQEWLVSLPRHKCEHCEKGWHFAGGCPAMDMTDPGGAA